MFDESMKQLEEFCKKPNAIRMVLLLEQEMPQKTVQNSPLISSGSYYGVLKELIALGIVERIRKVSGEKTVYYLRLTEKGKRVRQAIMEILNALSE